MDGQNKVNQVNQVGEGSVAPPAIHGKRPRGSLLLVSTALLAGILGVLISVAPSSLWPSACPATILALRHWVWRAVSSTSRPGAGPGLEPYHTYSPQELALHGSCAEGFQAKGGRTLLGVSGLVFDVTDKGTVYYGPGAAYCLFAGRDATRSLALGSLLSEDLALGGDVTGVDPHLVQDQLAFYLEKYVPAVGTIGK